jgi:hypothetical protein
VEPNAATVTVKLDRTPLLILIRVVGNLGKKDL